MAAKHSTRISSVGAATIGQGDIRVIVNALGTVTPIATVAVQTQLSGRLLEVGFTEGGQEAQPVTWYRTLEAGSHARCVSP